MTDFEIFDGLCTFSRGNTDWEPDLLRRLQRTKEEYESITNPDTFWETL